MTKEEKLKVLRKRVEEDKTLPLRKGATQLVFGEGNPSTDIYFLGEAPGYWEDQKGRPFVGAAGKLLDETLSEIGIRREEVYISNVVRFRPPGNRDPYPEELAAFAPYVDEEIEIINPKIIVTLGRFSMGKFLPDVTISRVHGKVFKIDWQGKERIIFPMFHPAAALRREDIMEEFKKDFKTLKKLKEDLEKEHDSKKVEQLNLI